MEAGGHGLLTFRRQDLIVVSPGVPLNTPELAQVRSFGLPVIGELELAARFLKGKTLAITGSNGKTTTTALVGEILKEAGMPTLVGGNIGVPVVGLIDQSTDETWSVLEVSSFQLESTQQFHPAIAVILNITPDHLDRHGRFENYALAKERIFAAQNEQDFVVLNADNARARGRGLAFQWPRSIGFPSNTRCARARGLKSGQIVYRAGKGCGQSETVMPLTGIPLKGEHNVENVLAAVCASRLAGASLRDRFARRLRISRRSSIAWNMWPQSMASSSTTTPRPPTWMRRRRPWLHSPAGIHLILGGKDKNSDYTQLADLLRVAGARGLHHRIGRGQDRIATARRGCRIHSCETLEQAVSTAASAAHPGEVVLLAPACSSFDQFENYEHRGRIFKELVHEWRGWKVWQNA